MRVNVRNISFKYKKNLPFVLKDVSCDIKESGITVLLGLNGCGKTTLLKILAGLEKPESGSIYYGDRDLNDITIRERSKLFSYVSQHSNVSAEIPVKQYLLYGTANSLAFHERPGQIEEELVNSVAERFQITHLLCKHLNQLSGGELQIVLIACAVVQRTPIIVLDEPTSALDIKNQSLVLSILKSLAEEGKKTILLSTHNPNHALYLGADVILLKDGTIAEKGEASKIVKIDVLHDVYGESLAMSKDLPYEEISFK